MLSSIFHAGTFSAATVAAAMASALVLGIVIAVLYKSSAVHIGSVTTILAVLPLLAKFPRSGNFGLQSPKI